MAQNGVEIIRGYLSRLPATPGVYRMLGAKGEVLYVGKAKDLKKRVTQYTHIEKQVLRIQRMVMATASMEFVTTTSEAEALLLEASLIKSLKPHYNILLRDDKSFPFIALSDGHDFPRIYKHRGVKQAGVSYFGPYASAGDVNRAITMLQKAFLLRSCTDNEFTSRTRPCMEYQIKRCSAPCVDYISQEDYRHLVRTAKAFLDGKVDTIRAELTSLMEQASQAMEYEKAALYRDRIQALAAVQTPQSVHLENVQDADVVGLYREGEYYALALLIVRGGQILGNRTFFPTQAEGYNEQEVLSAFLPTIYQSIVPPPLILLSHDLFDKGVIGEALSSLRDGKVLLAAPQKGEKKRLVELAVTNAKEAWQRKRADTLNEVQLLQGVAELFKVEQPIRRIDVFDNSHIFGKHAVGAMIVAGPEGFMKPAYRKYNVQPGGKTTGGDDTAMLREVLRRRYRNAQGGDNPLPDFVLVDGGAGQCAAVAEIWQELGLSIPFACIAKGPDRNAGREDFYRPGNAPFILPPHDAVLHYLQRLRDEAHRFAIGTYRKKHQASMRTSILDNLPDIGAKRKRALLHYFGSAKAVEAASIEELAKVDSISHTIAIKLYNSLHSDH